MSPTPPPVVQTATAALVALALLLLLPASSTWADHGQTIYTLECTPEKCPPPDHATVPDDDSQPLRETVSLSQDEYESLLYHVQGAQALQVELDQCELERKVLRTLPLMITPICPGPVYLRYDTRLDAIIPTCQKEPNP